MVAEHSVTTGAARLWRILVAVALLVGGAIVVPFASGVASAHYADMTASLNCTTGVIQYTARSWRLDGEPGSANPQIQISYQVDHSGPFIVDANSAFTGPNFTFSGSIPWPQGAHDVTVRATAIGTWDDGTPGSPGDVREVILYYYDDCNSRPTANVDVTCVNVDGQLRGSAVVTFSNNNFFLSNDVVTFGVTSPSGAFERFDVNPGDSTTRTFGPLGDGDYSFSYSINGGTPTVVPFTIDCLRPGTPAVSVDQVCADEDGTVTVLLQNIGGQLPLDFVVEGVTYTVPADSSRTVVISGLTDGSHTINISQGNRDFSQVVNTNCDAPPTVTYTEECVAGSGGVHDGAVTITLDNHGDDSAVTFTIDGVDHVVGPKGTLKVTIDGLSDGPHTITVAIDGVPSDPIVVDVSCDRPGEPDVSTDVECVDFDGTVTLTLSNEGGEGSLTFLVAGQPVVVPAGGSTTVTIEGVTDGRHTIAVFVGDTDLSVSVDVSCNPDLDLTPICDELSATDGPDTFWYSVTNNEDVPVTITWGDGTTTIPAHSTVTIKSTGDELAIEVGGEQVATAEAAGARCEQDVTVTKEVEGPAPAGEVYTIRISRLVGDSYVTAATVDLAAGETKTISLPSSLGPDGVDYIVQEIESGASQIQAISPDSFNLSGHLGETVSVVVTNSYAAVQLDKSVDLDEIEAGQQLTYTLVGRNTGGLVLHDVVVIDTLPSQVTYVSSSVAGNAGVCASSPDKPQVVACALDGTLAVGGTTPVITIVVTVDSGTPADTELVNQAKIVGFYDDGEGGEVPTTPSCVPTPTGSVCDLSPAVSTLVTERGSGGPTTTTTVSGSTTTLASSGGNLPSTGAGGVADILTVAVMLLGVGGLFMVVRRRGGSTV